MTCTKKNRQEKVIISAIEDTLDNEFAEYQKQLDEQIDKMNDALKRSKAEVLSDEDNKELKKLYRKIVKELHPDINPDVSEAQVQLFENAVSAYKNGDGAFRIVALLPQDRYEVWYVSYNGGAKSWYRIDRYFHRVPHEKMPDLYRQCHILLKTSVLESFSYPPLEMIATGGCAVVRENGGNREYLKDGENCLFYDPEDLQTAADAIERIVTDAALRDRLQRGGMAVADARDWSHCEAAVLRLYDAGDVDAREGGD